MLSFAGVGNFIPCSPFSGVCEPAFGRFRSNVRLSSHANAIAGGWRARPFDEHVWRDDLRALSCA